MQLPTPLDCMSRTPRAPAEVCAGEEPDAFLLGGQRNGLDFRVVQGAVDEHPVPGVRDVGELGHAKFAQHPVDLVRPGRARLRLAALLAGIRLFGWSHVNLFPVPNSSVGGGQA